MGYFSNGSEGMAYESFYCDRCVHQANGCAVWLAHELYNYSDCNNESSILHLLIPRTPDGANEECTMFIEDPRRGLEAAGQGTLNLGG